jgi:P-type Cu2+ transporter
MSAHEAADNVLCSHCLLPLGTLSMRRTVDGVAQIFCCYGCCLAYQVRQGHGEESEATWLLIRLGIGGFLSMNVMTFSLLVYSGGFEGMDAHLLPWVHVLLCVLATPVLFLLGGPFLRDTWQQATHGRLGSSSLITLAAGAAYFYSVVSLLIGGDHVYFDTATMLLVLFTLGRYLEAIGRARAIRSLAPLLEAEGQWATVVEGAAESRRLARELAPGSTVRVRPGERFPVDGVVCDGESQVDEALVTGESRPLVKSVGAPVIAGSINLDGPLLVRVTCVGAATRWARISRAVRDALGRKSPIQRTVDRVAGAAVPIVVLLSGMTVMGWWQVMPLDQALLVGLAVLVVACPCGLGFAAGLAGSLGIAQLARRGCLVRSGGDLEALATVRAVAFDKTGTITAGRMRLAGVETDDVAPDQALAQAAGLEQYAEHGLARGIVEAAAARGLTPARTHHVRTIAGGGVYGVSGGEPVAAGAGAWMRAMGWQISLRLAAQARQLEESGHSIVHVGWNGQVRALLSFDDTLRSDARATIEATRRLGLGVALLTGDLPAVACRIAMAAGIDPWHAALSPEGKQEVLAQLRRDCGPVAMVGDGLNDGPVLAAADVGIAVGGATDLAREAAALVLPKDGLRLLPWTLVVARAVRHAIVTSLIWTFGYNILALGLAMLGLLQPLLAAGMMAASSLIVVLNSLRLERIPEPDSIVAAAASPRAEPPIASGVPASADA